MLTNLFYYDFYKPYIFKNEKLTSKLPLNYNKADGKKSDDNNVSNENTEYSFFLNKSYKSETVNYAETISLDLNSIKNSVKNIINKTLSSFNFETLKDSFKSELKEFEKKYNIYSDFAEQNKNNSPLLSNFADNLKFRIDANYSVLSKFGLFYADVSMEQSENDLDQSLKLFFDESFFNSLSKEEISEGFNELQNFCKQIYNDTCEIMTVPMEEHMNFKNLSYYYNYIFSKENYNTVKIIETGMLVDISL